MSLSELVQPRLKAKSDDSVRRSTHNSSSIGAGGASECYRDTLYIFLHGSLPCDTIRRAADSVGIASQIKNSQWLSLTEIVDLFKMLKGTDYDFIKRIGAIMSVLYTTGCIAQSGSAPYDSWKSADLRSNNNEVKYTITPKGINLLNILLLKRG